MQMSLDEIKKAAGGEVEYGMDCVSEAKTVEQGSKAFASHGKIGLILPVDKSKSGDSIEHRNVLMYSIFNHDWKFGDQEIKAVPTDHTFAKELYAKISELLAAGKFKPNPVKKLGGLESVHQGFKDAESNKVRAAKIVYTIGIET